MKTILSIILLACLWMLTFAPASADNQRTPPGSFAKKRVLSVTDFVKQLKSDPGLMNRYARHFSMSPKQFIPYVQKNFKLTSLKKPLRATVWYISKAGKLQSKTKLLPKGTLVFNDAADRPVVVWSCGNPMSKKLVQPKVVKQAVKVPKETPAPVEPPVVAVVPPEPIEETVMASPEEVVETPPLVSPPVLTPPEVVELAEIPSVIMAPPASSSAFNALPILGVVALGGSLGKHGGTAIPEVPPALVVAIGLGALRVLAVRKKKD